MVIERFYGGQMLTGLTQVVDGVSGRFGLALAKSAQINDLGRRWLQQAKRFFAQIVPPGIILMILFLS